MMHDRSKFHFRLKQARMEAKLKQEVVARYLRIPTSAVSAFEAGHRKLEAFELYMISKLYQKPIGWFFGEQETEESMGMPRFFPNRQQAGSWDDPLIAECFNLLQRAPSHLQRSAAYGVIGFLSER